MPVHFGLYRDGRMAHVNLDKIRPKTLQKYLKAHRMVTEGVDHQIACARSEISRNWYWQIRLAREREGKKI